MKNLKTALLSLSLLFVIGCGSDDDNDNDNGYDNHSTLETITAIAAGNDQLTTLVTALEATGLDQTLDEDSNMYTVFAPTNAAFELLADGVLEGLLADTDALTGVLTYHVLAGKVEATAAVGSAGSTVDTVNGAKIGLSLDGSSLLVNTATVTVTDVQASNGVVHLIDAVLLPPTEQSPSQTIAEIATGNEELSTLVTALGAADLVSAVDDETANLTVFAPTNAAFAKIDPALLEAILADTELLTALLQQHVVNANIPAVNAYAANNTSVETLSTAAIPVKINSSSDTLTFGGATVTIADIQATNGVVHVIDTVVIGDLELPSVAQTITGIASSNADFETLTTALVATGLDSVLDDASASFTVFAPTDAAFEALPDGVLTGLLADTEALKNVLLYHVVGGDPVLADAALTVAQGNSNLVATANTDSDEISLSVVDGRLFINTAEVVTTDIIAENGVIHVIDAVLTPVDLSAEVTQNIAELATATPALSTLVSALKEADLVTTVSDESKQFTVFAPTNAAFDKVPDDALAELLANADALKTVLLQHVLPAAVDSVSAYAASGKTVTTAAENTLTVKLVDFKNAANADTDAIAYDVSKQILVAGKGNSQAGFAVYAFDDDLGSAGSTCTDGCATAWPPVLVSQSNTINNVEGLTTITRSNGDMQVAYLGRPLYFYDGDSVAGATNGEGVSDKWWTVKLPPVSLQIMGSNVTTANIKANNGIVHLIDTVIIEANQ